MTERANAVVLGSVERVFGSYLDRAQIYNVHTSDFVYNVTIFEFRIIRYAKGTDAAFVYILDIEDNDFRSELGIKEETILRAGETYVLFLWNDWSCAPSPPGAHAPFPPHLSKAHTALKDYRGSSMLLTIGCTG